MTLLALLLAAAVSLNTYHAEVTKVTDGDSFHVQIESSPDHFWKPRIRVRGIDTPELRSRCKVEEELALKAKATLKDILAKEVYVKKVWFDTYKRRYDADVYTLSGESVADLLIKAGVARPYDGKGPRKGWC